MRDESQEILEIKLNVLKCLSLLTIGNKLFNGHELQARLQAQLANPQFIMAAFV